MVVFIVLLDYQLYSDCQNLLNSTTRVFVITMTTYIGCDKHDFAIWACNGGVLSIDDVERGCIVCAAASAPEREADATSKATYCPKTYNMKIPKWARVEHSISSYYFTWRYCYIYCKKNSHCSRFDKLTFDSSKAGGFYHNEIKKILSKSECSECINDFLRNTLKLNEEQMSTFAEEGLDDDMDGILELTEEDLEELGITKKFAKRRILREIKKYKEQKK